MSKSNKNFNVLIVDEDKLVVKPLLNVLQKKGHCNIFLAKTCSDAIDLLDNADVVIVDLMLPLGNNEMVNNTFKHPGYLYGMDLALYIRSVNPQLKIIGYSIANSDYIKAFFEGINAKFFCKLRLDGFTEILNEILNQN